MTGFWRDTHARVAGESLTWPSEQRDFVEWHQGRSRFAVWAIAVDHPEVERRLTAMREALHPLLLPGYQRQAHVTLHICGFPTPSALRRDDFTSARLRAQIDTLHQQRPRPFRLVVGGAFSFVSAACLAVEGHGDLVRLRRAWIGSAPALQTEPYVPHITAGLYAGAWPLLDIERRLRSLVTLEPVDIEVSAVDWMTYDSGRVGGPLRTELRFDLRHGRVDAIGSGDLGVCIDAFV